MDKYWIWFKLLKLSHNKKLELIYKYKNILKIYEKLYKYRDNELLNKVEDIYKYNKKNKINVLNILDKNYPFLLKNINTPPILLYYKGQIEILNSQCITIFSGKNINEYGIKLIKYVCENLIVDNFAIVSRNEEVDKYIYNNNKKNIIVLSNGIKESVKYKNGIILSEYEYDVKNSKKNILERNRILTGITRETLIIQASYIDGLYYLVDSALEQGREISVFPGDVFDINNIYTNNLIVNGAKVINTISDLWVYEQKNINKNM